MYIDTYSEGGMNHLYDNDFVRIWNRLIDILSIGLIVLGLAMMTYDFLLK